MHHHLHFRRDGHAAFRQELHRQSRPIPGRRAAQMEFHRFHALLYDRIPSAVRRVDRIYVGLHAGRRRLLHTILLSYRRHR